MMRTKTTGCCALILPNPICGRTKIWASANEAVVDGCPTHCALSRASCWIGSRENLADATSYVWQMDLKEGDAVPWLGCSYQRKLTQKHRQYKKLIAYFFSLSFMPISCCIRSSSWMRCRSHPIFGAILVDLKLTESRSGTSTSR